MKTLLFLRNFRHFSGGHLKVWHYFQHVLESSVFAPRISFTVNSRWDASNPWQGVDPALLVAQNEIHEPEMLFVAGHDWQRLTPKQRRRPPNSTINLIQHVRHADKRNPLFQHLEHEAVRICVSREVADAILATGRVRGPVFTIPNAIDLSQLPAHPALEERSTDWLILGTKNRWLGRYMASRLWRPSRKLRLVSHPLPHRELLTAFADSRKVLLLPDKTEGFYLPALEAMALGAIVVCPDCIGNRGFCHHNTNCLRPEPQVASVMRAVQHAERLSSQEEQALVQAGYETAREHELCRERESFLRILHSLEQPGAHFA